MKDSNGQRGAICDCRDRNTTKHGCYFKKTAILETLEPKCNIQKESNMLRQPQRQTSPPIITHTAATPQDSPSTTIDDFPTFCYKLTTVDVDFPSPTDTTAVLTTSSTDTTQKTVRKKFCF